MSRTATGMGCPSCGEPVVTPAERDHFQCRACKAPLLAWRRRRLVTGGVEARLDAEAAREVLRRTLLDERAVPGLERTARAVVGRLVYVPFWELSAIQAGRLHAAAGRSVVVCRWAEAWCAAVRDRDELGLGEIDALRLRGREAAEGLHLLSPAELAGRGSLLPVDVSLDEVEDSLEAQARGTGAQAQVPLEERRFALLYYPVWLFRLRSGSDSYQVTVDGLTGVVLSGRLPARERPRATVLLAATGLAAAIVAGVWGPSGLLRRGVAPEALEVAAGVALALLGLVIASALSERTDLLYTNSVPSRVGVGRVGGWLGRLQRLALRAVGRVVFRARELGR